MLALKEEDVTKFLACSTHLGANNVDFQMQQYVYKVKADGKESNARPRVPVALFQGFGAESLKQKFQMTSFAQNEIVGVSSE